VAAHPALDEPRENDRSGGEGDDDRAAPPRRRFFDRRNRGNRCGGIALALRLLRLQPRDEPRRAAGRRVARLLERSLVELSERRTSIASGESVTSRAISSWKVVAQDGVSRRHCVEPRSVAGRRWTLARPLLSRAALEKRSTKERAMNRKVARRLRWLGAAVTLACTGCSSNPTAGEAVSQTVSPLTGGPYLLWFNGGTGEFREWLLNGTTVTGAASFAPNLPREDDGGYGAPVDTRGNTVLMDDGTPRLWTLDKNQGVTAGAPFSWSCDYASKCYSQWRAIGRMTLRSSSTGQVEHGLLWHNPSTGDVSMWVLADDGTTVTGTQSLSESCGPDDGCSRSWQAVLTADLNDDGNTDVLWYDRTDGWLSAWIIDDPNGHVAANTLFNWTCDTPSGCASDWHIVTAGDVNGDGHNDVLWHNPDTGELSAWLLDGNSTVMDNASLSQRCDRASGCAWNWGPIGFVTIPQGNTLVIP
jgi:hypothetical protein